MILFSASRSDKAAVNIANQLVANHGFEEAQGEFGGNPTFTKKLQTNKLAKLVLVEHDSIHTQPTQLPKSIKLLIFLSRHKSQSGIPTLSVHVPGNLGDALLGGLPGKVSVSPASAMKEALKAMKKAQQQMILDYEVSYECTHHGPSLDVPTLFVELGSSEKQWLDVEAAEAVARGALAAASCSNVYPSVLGVGGPHYNMKFTNLALETEVAFGHIIPKYAIGDVDVDVLRQCVAKTVEPVTKAVLDWKGVKGAEKPGLLGLLAEVGLEVERV
jgi:D-aminoacyl-tRNA deacylase